MKRMFAAILVIATASSSTGCAWIGQAIFTNLEHENRDTRLNSSNMTDSQRAKRSKADYLRRQDSREQLEERRRQMPAPKPAFDIEAFRKSVDDSPAKIEATDE